jgi:hypothetical protein
MEDFRLRITQQLDWLLLAHRALLLLDTLTAIYNRPASELRRQASYPGTDSPSEEQLGEGSVVGTSIAGGMYAATHGSCEMPSKKEKQAMNSTYMGAAGCLLLLGVLLLRLLLGVALVSVVLWVLIEVAQHLAK